MTSTDISTGADGYIAQLQAAVDKATSDYKEADVAKRAVDADYEENYEVLTKKKQAQMRSAQNKKNTALEEKTQALQTAQSQKQLETARITDFTANGSGCHYMQSAFAAASPGTWAFHKNKRTLGADTPIMYFTQRVTYKGTDYYAVAHIHGKFTDGTWEYKAGSADKLHFAKYTTAPTYTDADIVCTKVEVGHALKTQTENMFAAHDDEKTQWMVSGITNPMPKTARYPAQVGYYGGTGYDMDVQVGGSYGAPSTGGFELDSEIVVLSLMVALFGCVLCAILSFCSGGLVGYVLSRRPVRKNDIEDQV